MEDLIRKYPEIEKAIGYVFKEKLLLQLAFVHRSFYNENREKVPSHNERMEFLGDSVLGLIISDYLYNHLPDEDEGELSRLRAQLVEAASCARFLQKLSLSSYVLLGKGERMNEGRGRDTILADLFEALIGAIYLDGGLDAARGVFLTHFEGDLTTLVKEPLHNWKAELQDYSQKLYQKPPIYKVERETGPDHSKMFHVVAYLDDKEVGKGIGASKKEAEQAAAKDALEWLNKK